MKTTKISIILTIKGKTDTIKPCLEGILGQTYPNLELIVVSKTLTANVLKELKNFNKKVPVKILQKVDLDKGIQSRLQGYKNSTGEYVLFIDNATILSKDYIRKMFSVSEKSKADVCLADTIWLEQDKRRILPHEEILNSDFNIKNAFEKVLSGHGFDFLWTTLWNKLFARTLIERSVEFFNSLQEDYAAFSAKEDFAFCMVLLYFSSNLTNCHNVYCYKNVEVLNSNFGQDKKIAENLEKQFQILETLIGSENKYQVELDRFKNNLLAKNACRMDAFLIDFGCEYDLYEKILDAILSKETKVVSFDIFDTLLMRTTYNPLDIFIILGNEFRNELTSAPFLKFKDLRVVAEAKAREDFLNGELTLKDIYAYMVKNYGIDKDLANKIMERECQIEYEFSVCRNVGKDLYDNAMLNGKQVIYSSDMYLPATFIFSLLEKSGYSKQNRLFLSNEIKYSKHYGNLYDYVLKNLKISPSNMVHIGDNYYADVVNASNRKIKAFHLPNSKELFDRDVKGELINLNSSYVDLFNTSYIGVRSLFAIAANKLFDFPFYHKVSQYQCSPRYIGYYALGMHLYAFTDWIVRQSRSATCLNFVARDGYLPMHAYQRMVSIYDGKMPETNYVYASRKFLYSLTIHQPKDLIASVNLINVDTHSLEKLLGYLPKECINQDVYSKIPQAERCCLFGNIDTFCKKMDLIAKCIDFKQLANYQAKAKKYFSTLLKRNDMLVDIGYSGRPEAIFSELLGYPVNSLYLHPYKDDLYVNMHKYGFKTQCCYEYKPRVTGEIREFVFMKNAPSLLGINFDGNQPTLIFDKKDNNNEKVISLLEMLQANALAFVEDVCRAYKNNKDMLIFSNELACLPWENYINHSCDLDKIPFSAIVFEDDVSSGYNNLVDIWKAQAFPNVSGWQQTSRIRWVVGKLLPVGTKRRKCASKCINFLLPVGSRRRAFAKRILNGKKG